MRRLLGAAMIATLLAGCSGTSDTPARPANVSGMDPCGLLSDQERTDLHLRVERQTEDGHRRSCVFLTTKLLDNPRESRMGTLELTVRDSAAPNRVTDAKRVAETYRRERSARLTTTSLDGREIHHVGPAHPIGCRLLFQVNATSSLEASPMTTPQGPDCAFPDLTRLLSAKLPAPDPAPARADRDRPIDVLALDPCTLISTDRKASMRLGDGKPFTSVSRSCQYHTRTATPGSLEFVYVTISTSGAKGTSGEKPATRAVNERTAYEERKSGAGTNSTSDCEYRLEVTAATSVHVKGKVLGPDNLEPACVAAAGLAADIEPKLPLIAT
ncbi:DUF3558 family protein [Kibdelosporangium phytohabitans]|uniref:DUF3558 domain-containing protein n=1 Tax=Kibdelosporangium phytohabitans TaxID=860235 RepID=A0A0N9I470_9PSEU|nr:DUF3558 family protein [Kibdelosporangium phytohabitans]ALG09369.1 hypothetical protein AOZ06_22855 [Kibdelosporangium phytohabitans]MBE1469362.1 hypothetical protein [Kibdelosporangium phytohabitans]